MRHTDFTYWFTFNMDASRIATGCNDGVARIWDTRPFRETRWQPKK